MLRLVLLTRWKDAPGAKAEAEAAKQSAIAEEESFMVNYHGLYLSNVQGFMRRRCFRLLSSSEQGDNKGSGEWLLSLMMLPVRLVSDSFCHREKAFSLFFGSHHHAATSIKRSTYVTRLSQGYAGKVLDCCFFRTALQPAGEQPASTEQSQRQNDLASGNSCTRNTKFLSENWAGLNLPRALYIVYIICISSHNV